MEIEGIVNAKALVEIYGYCPSFHDAVVLRLVLDRGGVMGPEMTAQIDLWEPDRKMWDKHTLVTLLFRGIEFFILSDFTMQNMLDGVSIVPISPSPEDKCRFSVRFDAIISSFGPEMEFRCREIEVINVAPSEPPNTRSI